MRGKRARLLKWVAQESSRDSITGEVNPQWKRAYRRLKKNYAKTGFIKQEKAL